MCFNRVFQPPLTASDDDPTRTHTHINIKLICYCLCYCSVYLMHFCIDEVETCANLVLKTDL